MKDGLTESQKKIIRAIEEKVPRILKLPEPDKSRCLLCLSYEYFLQDMEEMAFKLLNQSDPDYFKNYLDKDMKNDPNLNHIIMTILSKLIETGYVKTKINNKQ